jgi:F-type H+-transporting ATPase subunit a
VRFFKKGFQAMLKKYIFFLLFVVFSNALEAGGDEHHGEYDPAGVAIHHISDGNVYTILDVITFPLPVILFIPGEGWQMFSSGKFQSGHHEDGKYSYNGFVLHHGSVYRVMSDLFPKDSSVELEDHPFVVREGEVDGMKKDLYFLKYNGQEFPMDPRSTWDGGFLGGGVSSFYDFSITKNVVSIIFIFVLMFFVFRSLAKKYQENPNKAPSGFQGLIEPVVLFVRDEVAIPFIGKDKYRKFLTLLLSLFFFILGLNLYGQIPFLGGTNVTGSLTVTMVLAVLVFIIVNIHGTKDYWQHIFWMPGIPVPARILLGVIETLGLFIKPLTLMLRLAGNISAGHIAILSFIGLIFVFGQSGANLQGSVIGTIMAIPLTLFMSAIELFVAFVQAYVFTMLTASYIGAALEDHHHEAAHH